jgi:hypothetical protein
MIYSFPEELGGLAKNFVFTGSAIVCDPPVTNTDVDLVIYVDSRAEAHGHMLLMGYTVCGDYENCASLGTFQAYRKGALNVIVVDQRSVFLYWQHATRIATELNITEKSDRIFFFEMVYKCMTKIAKDAETKAPWEV